MLKDAAQVHAALRAVKQTKRCNARLPQEWAWAQQGGNGAPTVILIKTRRGLFEDMGGELDKRIVASADALKMNAAKEVSEESQGLFIINHLNLERDAKGIKLYSDISDVMNAATYRCYYVVLTGTGLYKLDQLFRTNKNLLKAGFPFMGPDMDESIDISRFYLSSIKASLANTPSGGILCNDVNGVACTIRDRTAECLRSLINNSTLLSAVFDNQVTTMFEQDRNVFSSTSGIVRLKL